MVHGGIRYLQHADIPPPALLVRRALRDAAHRPAPCHSAADRDSDLRTRPSGQGFPRRRHGRSTTCSRWAEMRASPMRRVTSRARSSCRAPGPSSCSRSSSSAPSRAGRCSRMGKCTTRPPGARLRPIRREPRRGRRQLHRGHGLSLGQAPRVRRAGARSPRRRGVRHSRQARAERRGAVGGLPAAGRRALRCTSARTFLARRLLHRQRKPRSRYALAVPGASRDSDCAGQPCRRGTCSRCPWRDCTLDRRVASAVCRTPGNRASSRRTEIEDGSPK